MITVVGVFVLIIAVIAGLSAVFSTGGDPHALTGDFTVFRYHVADTAGLLLLWGMVVGLIALVVLGRLLVDAKRADRRELVAAHSETASPSHGDRAAAPTVRRTRGPAARFGYGSARPTPVGVTTGLPIEAVAAE